MPRQEKPLNPADGPLSAFACELRALRAAAGLTYREIAKLGHYTHPVFVKAAGGEVLPRWEVVKEFVTACGAPAEEITRWQQRWQETKDALDATTPATITASTAPPTRRVQLPIASSVVPLDGGFRWTRADLYVPDPQHIRAPADLAMALRKLKASAGDPSFETLSSRAFVSRSTMADQCNPARRRFDWSTVSQFLDACRVPPDDHRIWQAAFYNTMERSASADSHGPVPQVDLTEVDSPAALAQALTALRTAAGVSYSELRLRADRHAGLAWRLSRSTIAAKIQNAIRDNVLLDREMVMSFVHFCHCTKTTCSRQEHDDEVQRWLAVYDQLLPPEPRPSAHRFGLIAGSAVAAVLLLLLLLVFL